MEARVAVVEGEEAVHRELRAEVVILAREHLLAHAGADLGLEVEDGAKAEVAAFAALVVLGVLDPSAATERVHAGVDVLVEMQALLRLGHAAACVLDASARPSKRRHGP